MRPRSYESGYALSPTWTIIRQSARSVSQEPVNGFKITRSSYDGGNGKAHLPLFYISAEFVS